MNGLLLLYLTLGNGLLVVAFNLITDPYIWKALYVYVSWQEYRNVLNVSKQIHNWNWGRRKNASATIVLFSKICFYTRLIGRQI